MMLVEWARADQISSSAVKTPIDMDEHRKAPYHHFMGIEDKWTFSGRGKNMNENDRTAAAELKELEYNIAHLENEKQKGWLSPTKQNQLAEDRARRDEIMEGHHASAIKQGADAIKALKYLT
ncbi:MULTISPECIES: hypothetical protein [Neorhizobium]|uniref:hypothetical protein n=1 Tax=Neorhizobium sp. T6_25 TaxID=2093833 RepID=UPI00155EAC22|nr:MULTISPECIES: hypothetical protein [Neorhizobium]